MRSVPRFRRRNKSETRVLGDAIRFRSSRGWSKRRRSVGASSNIPFITAFIYTYIHTLYILPCSSLLYATLFRNYARQCMSSICVWYIHIMDTEPLTSDNHSAFSRKRGREKEKANGLHAPFRKRQMSCRSFLPRILGGGRTDMFACMVVPIGFFFSLFPVVFVSVYLPPEECLSSNVTGCVRVEMPHISTVLSFFPLSP